jgi:WD40 repeat protein
MRVLREHRTVLEAVCLIILRNMYTTGCVCVARKLLKLDGQPSSLYCTSTPRRMNTESALHLAPVNVLAESHGRWLALASNKHLFVTDLSQQSTPVRALEGHDSIIRAVYWYTAPGDNQPSYLLSAGDDKRLFVWNCSDWSRSEPV